MARTMIQSPSTHINQHPSSSHEPDTYTLDLVNLNNLLTRLEHNIYLSSSTEGTELRQLPQSQLHCLRVGANIDYAQTLIKKIERSLPAVKAPAVRHERTTDLGRKRDRYEKIKERFETIKEEVEKVGLGYGREDEEEHQERDGAGRIGQIIGNDDDHEEDDFWEGLSPVERQSITSNTDTTVISPVNEKKEEDQSVTSTIRQRHGDRDLQSSTSATTTAATATGTSHTPSATATTATKSNTSPPSKPSDTTEDTLFADRSEQESLTTSLLTLASQLKASSETFQASLESEKGILNRAVEGLDRNITGMEAAGKRMGVLRRMTEGRGWWGRMIMYAWIFALWIVALAIVYVGPKLRF